MARKNNGGTGSGPFMIALVIALVVIGGVMVRSCLRSNEPQTDSVQIQRTAGQYYGALNKGRYQDLVNNTCKKDREAADFPKSAGFEEQRKKVVEQQGEQLIKSGDDFKDLKVDGDSATARLTLTYDKGDPKRTESVDAKFVREDGKWKMCS